MDEKKYFKFPVVYFTVFVVDSSVIILSLFLVKWQTASVVWGVIFLGLLMTILPLLSWPVIKDDRLEIWWLIPRIKKQFLYGDIQRVVFKRGGRQMFALSIFGLDGKRKYWGAMECVPVNKLQEFLDDLRAHGVEVDNRMNYKDVI